MPKDPKFFIKDTQTGLWCSFYSVSLPNCGWDIILNAVDFGSQENADAAITAWGETPGQRFIGSNPPPH